MKPFTKNDQVLVKFWNTLLSKCVKVKHLLLSTANPIGSIIKALGWIVSDLVSVWIVDKSQQFTYVAIDLVRRHFLSSGTTIFLQTESLDEVDEIIAQCSDLPGKPCVIMLKEERTEGFDLGSYIRPTMGKLCLRDTSQKLDTYCSLTAVIRIPQCPYFTHLSLSRFS